VDAWGDGGGDGVCWRSQEERSQESAVWQKFNPLAADVSRARRGGGGQDRDRAGRGAEDILTKDFLRKYIFYAKNRVFPQVRCAAAVETKGTWRGAGG
jgi:DNA replicative helicase MCM subunit Mcm2 (Cdc46/Mcm family)